MAPADVNPPRIKVYGLVALTKRTYVIVQLVGLCFVTALMAVGVVAMVLTGQLLPRFAPPPPPAPPDGMLLQYLIALFWLGLLTLLLEGIETFVVLRKFARAEARAGQASPDTDPRHP